MKTTACIFLLLFVAFFSFSQTKSSSVKTKSSTTAVKKSKISHLPPDVEIWTVDAQLGKCEGVTTRQCMLVKQQGKKEFELFYDTIRGFDYREGFVYVIQVKKILKSPPVPADAPIYDYFLEKIVSKKEIKGYSNTFTETKKLNSGREEDRTRTLVINEEKAPCSGTADGKCLLVKKDGAKEFELFYHDIAGFTFEEGFRQTILVRESYSTDPATGAMQTSYTLLSTSKKEAVKIEKDDPSGTAPSWTHGKTPLDKKWYIRKMKDSDTSSFTVDDNAVWIEFYSIDNRFKGKAPCNEYFGGFKSDLISSFQASAITNSKIDCANSKLEELYFTLLQNADRYTIRDGRLIFYKGDRLLLIFE
jgi:hypothetical protein